MDSKADFGIKKYLNFYDIWPPCVNVVTMKPLKGLVTLILPYVKKEK